MDYEGKHSSKVSLKNTDPIQMGFWVPNRVWATHKYLVPLRKHLAEKKANGTLTPMTPVMQAFRAWVSANSIYRMWLNTMIDEANEYVRGISQEDRDKIEIDGDTVWLDGYDSLFEILNEIITTSPSFNNTAQVGTPMNGLLAVSMATKAGVALFHDATFNAQFKKVLDAWNTFLKSPESLDKLDIREPEKAGSWISQAAWDAGVWDQMIHDKTKLGYGYDSWNAFFIRKFVKDARPFEGPSSVINIGCETTPWQYQNNVSRETDFWVKSVNYSLFDLFAGIPKWSDIFEGGQIYQGFLSATHYHRWNAPMDGEIVRSWVQPGTYFAQRPGQPEGQGTWEGTDSQPYLGHVATRAIFIFKHAQCGYVALFCIGMVEVSTCYIEPKYLVAWDDKPVAVERGEGIGHFEFGGSTHMMIFEKDKVKLEEWALNASNRPEQKNPTKMGTIIARPV